MKNIESKYVSIGEAADMLGLSVVTLRRYEKSGKLKSSFRTFGLHRRYDINDIRKLINPAKESKKTSCYARVSTHDQKKDLITQVDKLKNYCIESKIENFEVIQDLGSGLNYKKKGFKQLLNFILTQKIDHLILNHKDRLLRFGSEIIFSICQFFNIKVTIIEKQDVDFENELVQNVLEIMTVFTSKLYGSRSHKNKNKIIQATTQQLIIAATS